MLTAKQRDVMLYLQDYMRESGDVAPSIREMGKDLSLSSTAGLHAMLCRLEERGYIRRIRNRARALEIIRRVKK